MFNHSKVFAIVCLLMSVLATRTSIGQNSCTVVAWGLNYYGQCNVPSPNSGFTAIAAGYGHSLGLKTDGTVVAWGYNRFNQCEVPTPNTGFMAIAAGGYHSLGLKEDGTIVAWGHNAYGQCNVPSPNTGFMAIAAGWYHSMGLKEDGTVVAWGNNENGQCNVPSPNTGFMAIAAGAYYSLGLKEDGTIVVWGNNSYGICNVPSPNTGFVAIAAGGYHSLGLKEDGTIVAWGNNEDGQCNVPSPNTGFVAIASGAGSDHSLGLKTDSTVVAWGLNADGQCNVPSPNTGFTAISAGYKYSMAIRGSAVPFITVTSPNGEENWKAGSSQDIIWTSVGTSGNVMIEYSTNNGSSWTDVIASTPDDGTHPWTIPDTPSSTCLVKVSDTDGSPSDQSDAVFTISPLLTHFTPVTPTGKTQPVYISDATLDGIQLQAGDEIGIYDGTLCVGAATVTSFPMSDPVVVYLEYTPPGGSPLPGAHDGNDMLFRIWDQSADAVCSAHISEVVSGTPVFSEGAIVAVKLDANSIQHFTETVNPTGRTQPVYISDATLDGTQLQAGDEIGVFDDTLCVGAGKVTSFPMKDPIIVYLEYTPPGGTSLPGAHDGNNMSFKVWDQSADREEDAKISEVVSGTPVFAEGAIVSLKLEAPCELTQQITIQPNKLNLISFYVTPENLDASAVFDSLTNFVVAFNDNGKYRIPPDIVYPGHPGTNTIGDIEPCEGYSIFISGDTPQTLSLTGLPIDASSLVCTVDNGKLNKIAFPKQNTQPIADVFNATANPDLWPHFVVAFDDEGQYFIPPDIVFPGHPGTNSIGDMVPGKGYSLFHNGDSPITYTFPESAGSPPLAKAKAKKESSFSEPDHFTFVKTGEPHAVFLRSESPLLEKGDELGVFVGGLCVGSMKYEDSLSDPLVIWQAVEEYNLSGIKQGDKLTLRHWIKKTNEIEEVFIEGDIYFDKDRPFSVLNLTGSTIFEGINKLSDNIPERMALYQNYPNPFNPSTIIRFDINKPCNVSLVVYNVNGQVVSTLVDKFMSKGEYSVMWKGKTDNGNRVGSGVYLVHLRAGKYSFTRKVLLVE